MLTVAAPTPGDGQREWELGQVVDVSRPVVAIGARMATKSKYDHQNATPTARPAKPVRKTGVDNCSTLPGR